MMAIISRRAVVAAWVAVACVAGVVGVVGCRAESDRPAAVAVVHPAAEVAQAVSLLLEGTGIPVRQAPAGGTAGEYAAGDAVGDGWTDVSRFASDFVDLEAAALADAFPNNAARITSNRERLVADLVRLDAYARRVAELVPESNRRIESSHEQLRAFAEAYGFEFVQSGTPTDLDAELLFAEPAPPGAFEATYVGKMDHTITFVAAHLGAPGIDIHGTTGRLTLGHDHAAHAPQAGHDDHHDHDGHDH